MEKKTHSRKDFIKKTTLTLGFASLATIGVFAGQSEQSIIKLPADQQQFVRFYKQWLNRFSVCAQKQQKNAVDSNNNKELMTLAEESKMWNNQLRMYMEDPVFSAYFTLFSEQITEEIV